MAPTTRKKGKTQVDDFQVTRGRGRGKGCGGQGAGGQVVGGQVDEGARSSKRRKLNALEEEDKEILPTAPQSILTFDEAQTTMTKITVQSRNFESLVLRPRRIVKMNRHDKNGVLDFPYSHFETAPPDGQALSYKDIEGLDAAEIWLSLSNDDAERIVEEYTVRKNKRSCEQEYAAFATETFLKGQRQYLITPKDWKWRAERTLQLHAPPIVSDDSVWVAPPSFDKQGQEFKFDIRPDCSYWLSLAGFNSEYLGEVENVLYVHEDALITCPYFTIEFKKYGHSPDQAQWQACAAASMGLYNRYRLKSDALKAGAEQWNSFHKAQVKHYVMTLIGRNYHIWVLQPDFSEDFTWNGCSMTTVCLANCGSKIGVRRLEAWLNEIHRWGLSKFAAGCEADVKTILRHAGVEVSGIDFEPQVSQQSKSSEDSIVSMGSKLISEFSQQPSGGVEDWRRVEGQQELKLEEQTSIDVDIRACEVEEEADIEGFEKGSKYQDTLDL